MTKEELLSLSKEELAELVEICSKNAIAMDGVWFQSVERIGAKVKIESCLSKR